MSAEDRPAQWAPDGQKYGVRRRVRDWIASDACPHQGGKRLDGNIFRCIGCNKAVGFLRAP